MSAPVLTRSDAIVGDGTTSRGRARSRWRRWRGPLVVLAALAVVALLAALPEPRTSTDPLAPDNPGADGARAAAQILRREGVDVHYVRHIADVRSAAHAGSTVLVVGDGPLDDADVAALRATGADLALVEAGWALEQLTDQLRAADRAAADAVAPRQARCDDADATAAGTVTVSGGFEALGTGAVVCFPGSGDAAGSGAYAVVEGSQRIAALSDATPLTNAALAEQGNAALVLRMLGRHDDLVWYLPTVDDDSSADASGPPLRDLVPRSVPLLALALALVLAVAALWRGRRLGRLVVEQLPVVVRSGEATRGRGRLYRRARAHGHAGAALRAGAATRCATRLGLGRAAEPTVLVVAIAQATGRDPQAVHRLLYGPPPTDDRALTRLARDLDDLESEVQHS